MGQPGTEGTGFDKFAREYTRIHARNIRLSGETPEFFARYKIDDVARCSAEFGLIPRQILDFGSGVGVSIPHWRSLLPDTELVCMDISERSLEIARQQYPHGAMFIPYDGRSIPLPAGQFDIVFAACVFHHIEPGQQIVLLKELHRVMTADGLLFIFEHNPLNPLTVRAFNTCEFDQDAVLIRPGLLRRLTLEAGFREISLAYRIFFPGILGRLRPMERFLTWLPAGAQYRLIAQP